MSNIGVLLKEDGRKEPKSVKFDFDDLGGKQSVFGRGTGRTDGQVAIPKPALPKPNSGGGSKGKVLPRIDPASSKKFDLFAAATTTNKAMRKIQDMKTMVRPVSRGEEVAYMIRAPTETKRRRSTISLYSNRDVLDALTGIQDQQKKRHQESINTELNKIKKRINTTLENVGMESESSEEEDDMPAGGVAVKLPPIYDTRAERNKMQERNYILGKLDNFEEKSLVRKQYLTELNFWFQDNMNLCSDVVTPDELKQLMSEAQELHAIISKSLIKFITNGDRVVEKGKSLLVETSKLIEEKRANMAKKTKKERIIVWDDKALMSDPIKWESSAKTIISVFEDCHKMIRNVMFKNAIRLGQKQFDYLMIASEKRYKELDEKKKQCTDLQGKLHTAKQHGDKLLKTIEEQKGKMNKLTSEMTEAKNSLEKCQERNKEMNTKIGELNSKIKFVQEELKIKNRTPTPPPTPPPPPEPAALKNRKKTITALLNDIEWAQEEVRNMPLPKEDSEDVSNVDPDNEEMVKNSDSEDDSNVDPDNEEMVKNSDSLLNDMWGQEEVRNMPLPKEDSEDVSNVDPDNEEMVKNSDSEDDSNVDPDNEEMVKNSDSSLNDIEWAQEEVRNMPPPKEDSEDVSNVDPDNEEMVKNSDSEDDSNVDPDNEEMVKNSDSEEDSNVDSDNEEMVKNSDSEDDSNVDSDNEEMVKNSDSEDDSKVDSDNEEMVKNSDSEDDSDVDPNNEEIVNNSDLGDDSNVDQDNEEMVKNSDSEDDSNVFPDNDEMVNNSDSEDDLNVDPDYVVKNSDSEDDSNDDPDNEEMVNNRDSEDYLNVNPDNEEMIEISDMEAGDSHVHPALDKCESLADAYVETRKTSKIRETVKFEHPQSRDTSLSPVDVQKCVKYPKIYTKKYVKASNTKSETGRNYDKVHACFFCGKLRTNIQTHLLKHFTETDVKKIKDLQKTEKCSLTEEAKTVIRKEITKKQNILRNRGDNKHNLNVCHFKEGELLVSRRRGGDFDSRLYGGCPECGQWMILKQNYTKHRNMCPFQSTISLSAALVQGMIFKGQISMNASPQLAEVFKSMKKDEISMTAMEDSLIIALGETHFFSSYSNKLKRKNYASFRMRLGARLLKLLRIEIGNNEASMNDCLVVENFDAFVKCALLACGKNSDEELEHPSVAVKLSDDLNKMVSAKIAYGAKSRNETDRKEGKMFASVLAREWKLKVKKQATLLLQTRQFNRTTALPDPEDIATLATFMIGSLKAIRYEQDIVTYRQVAMLTEARLLLYNRRRPGELSELDIATYQRRSTTVNETDLSLREELTPLEQKLLKSQELLEMRGKCHNRIPLLLPEEVRKPLEYLTDSHVRDAVGIKDKKFVFASTGVEPIRAGTALDVVKYQAKLKYPERILATNLRKHTATISQVMGLEDNELRWLVNHLGHTEKVHLQHYRATSGLIERLDVAKLMLLQEKNAVGRFAGLKLSEIQFEDLDEETDTGVVATRNSIAENIEEGNLTPEEQEMCEQETNRKKKKKPEQVIVKVVDSATELRLQEVEVELAAVKEEVEKLTEQLKAAADNLRAEQDKTRQLNEKITELESIEPEPLAPPPVNTPVMEILTPEISSDRDSNYYKTLMAGMKNEFAMEMEKVKSLVKREKNRGEAGVRKTELQHKDHLMCVQKDTVRMLRAIVHFRDHMISCLEKENLIDQSQSLYDLGDLLKNKLSPDPKEILATIVGTVVDYLNNMERILSQSFLALKIWMKTQIDKQVEQELLIRMAKEKHKQETKIVTKECKKKETSLREQNKDAGQMAKRLKKAKNKLKKGMEHLGPQDKRYKELLARYNQIIQLYANMQKEMEILQSDFHDTMQRKLEEKEAMVISQIKMEMRQQRVITEKQLKVSLGDQKENLKLLTRAYEDNKISKDLHVMATAMIRKTLEIPRHKLQNLFEQYITYRTVKESKERVHRVLLDKESDLTIDTRKEMELYMEQMDGRFSDSMQKWRQKMKALETEKRELNKKIYRIFNEVLLETGVLLVHPLLKDKNKRDIVVRATTTVSRKQMTNFMFKRRGYKTLLEMPDSLQGNSVPLQHGHNRFWSQAYPPAEPDPGVTEPHMLAYDINRPTIQAARQMRQPSKPLHLRKTESFHINQYNNLQYIRDIPRNMPRNTPEDIAPNIPQFISVEIPGHNRIKELKEVVL